MATNATAISDAFSPTTATATTATGTAKGGATGTDNILGSTSVSYAPKVTATGTSTNLVTKIESCNCCGPAVDQCCGPFPQDGNFFLPYFGDYAPFSSRAKTTSTEKFELNISFINFSMGAGINETYRDLIQTFSLPFEYYDPGPSFSHPFVYNPSGASSLSAFISRYNIARWTNTGPIKATIQNNNWSDKPSSTAPYGGKIGTVWINFESEYIYLVLNYQSSFSGTYVKPDKCVNFILLSSLDDLDSDSENGFWSGYIDGDLVAEDQSAFPSSYKLFFQRWDPIEKEVYGNRYVMKTSELATSIYSGLIYARQMTMVSSATTCPFRVDTYNPDRLTYDLSEKSAVAETPIVITDGLVTSERFRTQFTFRRQQTCFCKSGFSRNLFGPAGGLCPEVNAWQKPVELVAKITSLAPVSPYVGNTSWPATPHILAYFSNSVGIFYLDPCTSFLTSNNQFDAYKSEPDSFSLSYASLEFTINNSGNLVANLGTNANLGLVWSTYPTGTNAYSFLTIRGTNGSNQMTYVSHSCNPFSLVFSGSIYIGAAKAANIEITFTFPDNGLISMESPMVFNDGPEASQLIRQSKERISIPCIHRGVPLEESASCGCGGAVLTECKIYGQCRPYGTATDAQICTRCEDYEPVS